MTMLRSQAAAVLVFMASMSMHTAHAYQEYSAWVKRQSPQSDAMPAQDVEGVTVSESANAPASVAPPGMAGTHVSPVMPSATHVAPKMAAPSPAKAAEVRRTVPAAPVAGSGDGTDAALDLADASDAADASGQPPQPKRPWQLSVQDAVRASDFSDVGHQERNQFSLDFTYQQDITSSLDLNLSARYDRFDPLSSGAAASSDKLLLREAYASWRLSPYQLLDVGRFNERVGAAFGYNPTDAFRANAVDIKVSPDPQSRRTNRLGTIGLRAQQLWDTGALSLILSPRLSSYMPPGDPSASTDLQRTNGSTRWMLVASQQLTPAVQPQLVLSGGQGQQPLLGMNLSVPIGQSVVAYAEWAGGERPSLMGRALDLNDSAFRASSALGATWTLPMGLSLTAEYQGNGAGGTAAQWQAMGLAAPQALYTGIQTTVAEQDIQTRHGFFGMAQWPNIGMPRLDLSGFVQVDISGGEQYWIELRRRFDRFDLALQWQRQTGLWWNRFGAMKERSSAQLLGIFYL